MGRKTKENKIQETTDNEIKKSTKELIDEYKAKMSNAIITHWQKIEQKYYHKDLSWGYPTKFYEYDELTGGLQNSELTVVAARHSMGKTSFVLSLFISLLQQKIPVLFISYEMNKDVFFNRILSMCAEIDSQKIKNGNLREKDFEKLIEALNLLTSSVDEDLFNVIPECTYRYKELAEEIRKFKTKHKSGVIIIDYFQLIELTKDEDRYSELTNMAASFKRLAIEIDLPIILVSQVSKKREDNNNKRPRLSDLAECDALAQHCDNLIFIYRDDYYTSENYLIDETYEEKTNAKGETELIVAKHKNGPIKTCKILFQSNIAKFKSPMKSESIF